MATSGTFTGARGGSGTGPYLSLSWSRLSTDVTNNRSQIRLTLNLVSDYTLNFSASKSGVLYGNSFTYTSGFSGTGTKTLKTLDVWVNHNADGTKTETFSATFNIAISWGGTSVSSLSVSGSATIDTIPRASSFSISGNTIGSAITVNITRASSSFTHKVSYALPDGTVRASWSGVATQQIFTPAIGDCQYITGGTSATASITVETFNGSTSIGSSKQTFTINVPTSVVPTATGLSTSISGTGRDKTLNKYIQNISKLYASFTASGIYGSSITSSSITVKRQSDSGNSQTISGTSGTTANVLSLSGTYIITASVTDSRGRTASASTTVTVVAYTPPSISKFTAVRTSTTTTVSSTITAAWSLGTDNPTSVIITGKNNVGTVVTLYTLTNSTADSLNTTRTFTSQSDASSYTYVATVTDSFGMVSTSTAIIGTSFVEMTIAKGKGVGIGKVWESGALDVAGVGTSTGGWQVSNPNASTATVALNWRADRARLRYGGTGTGSSGGFAIEGPGDNVKLYISDGGELVINRLQASSGIVYGSFGVNGGSVTDFNGVLTEGEYIVGSGSTLSNAPYSGSIYGKLKVTVSDGGTHNNSNNWIWQEFIDTSGRVITRRKVNNSGWSGWLIQAAPIVTSALWTGVLWPSGSDTLYPSKLLGDCQGGWCLAWSDYNVGQATPQGDFNWVYTFIPKQAMQGVNTLCTVGTGEDGNTINKAIYFANDRITGSNYNDDDAARQDVVLRAVYEY